MCGAALVAPLAMAATSFLGSGKSRGVQSYSPQEIEMTPQLPDPTPEEPTLGVDNSDNSSKKASQGKSALVNPLKRNPGVSVAGGGGSGVNIAGR